MKLDRDRRKCKKNFISNFWNFTVFSIFDPKDQELYFFLFIAGEGPPAGAYFPLLVEGCGILGDRVRGPGKSLSNQ